nr:hypothetical protein [Roseateles sp. DAIF2]
MAFLQRLRHLVEGGVEQAELVLALLADAEVVAALSDLAERLDHQLDRAREPVGHEVHRHRDRQHRHQHQHRHQGHRQAGHAFQRPLGQAQRDSADRLALEGDRRLEAEHHLAIGLVAGALHAGRLAQRLAGRWLVGQADGAGQAGGAHDAAAVGDRDALEIARLHHLLQRDVDRHPVLGQGRDGVLRRDEARQRRAIVGGLAHQRGVLALDDDRGGDGHHRGDDQGHHAGPFDAQRHDALPLGIARLLVDLGQHAHQRVGQLGAALEAALRRLGQAAVDDAAQRGGQAGALLFQWRMLLLGDLQRQGDDAVAAEGALAGEHLVEHDAGREQVRAAVDLVALHLFGRHVLRRAQHIADAGALFAAGGLHMRDAEVHHLDVLRAAHAGDVAGLDVAMHDAALVRIVERARQLDAHHDDIAHRQRQAGLQYIGQRFAVQQLHRHIGAAVDLADIVHGDDVGVRQRTGGACLAQEARAVFLVLAQRGMQELDRDIAPDTRVMGAEHAGHAAAPQAFDDLVAADLAQRRLAGGGPRLGAERAARQGAGAGLMGVVG